MSREDDAKRDLARIEREREKLLFDSGTSDDDNDPVVKLGKRIARALGFLLAIALLVYLFATYLT